MRLALVLSACLLCAPAVAADSGEDVRASSLEAGMSVDNMFTGNTLYELRGLPRFFEGYVSGVADVGSMMDDGARRYCMPAGVKVPQMADVAYKFLVDNPATRNLGAAFLVRQAFHEAWPCREAPTSQAPRRKAPAL